MRNPVRDGKVISKYLEALKAEIRAYGGYLRDLDLRVWDIHAGGGTPSLLNRKQLEEVLNALAEHLGAEPKMAIEANPEDLADEKHTFDLADHGVAEVSLGVQSFNRNTLRELRRRHGVEDSLRSVENLHRAGVEPRQF